MLSQISRTRDITAPFGIYLDNDGTGGDGSIGNPYGPFSEIPWSSIDTAISAGRDVTINLMRGREWNTEFEIKTSGSVANRITVQPYDGEEPPSAGRLITDDPYVNTNLLGLNVMGVFMDGKSNVTIDGIYCSASGTDPTYGLVNNFLVKYPAENITFKNCTAFYSDDNGFFIQGDVSSIITNVEIIDCLTDDNIEDVGYFLRYVDGGGIRRCETRFRCGEQCCYLLNTTNVIVEKNTFYEGRTRAVLVQGLLSRSNIIRKNLINDAGVAATNLMPAILFLDSGGANEVYLNVVTDGNKFISFYNILEGGNIVYNNSYWANDGYVIYTTGAVGGNILKNNILSQPSTAVDLVWANGGGAAGYVFVKNLWFTDSPINAYQWNAQLDFSEWQSIYGFDIGANNYFDPKYVDGPNNDLTLQASSLARSGAVSIGDGLRLDPTSVWPNALTPTDVKTISQPATRGAFAYV